MSGYLRSTDVCPKGQKDANNKPTKDWIDSRGKLILSGTTIGAICPIGHPFKTSRMKPSDIIKRYCLNFRKPISEFAKKAMQHGNDHEDTAVQKFASGGNFKFKFPGLLISKECEMWGGSPDGVEINNEFIIEVKNLPIRQFKYNQDGSAMIPQEYLAQSQFYMYLTGIRRCAFIQNKESVGLMEVTWMDYDEENTLTMIEAARKFTEHVLEFKRKFDECYVGINDDLRYIMDGREKNEDGDDICTEPLIRLEKGKSAILEKLETMEQMLLLDAPLPEKRAPYKRKERENPVEEATGFSGDGLDELRKRLKGEETEN